MIIPIHHTEEIPMMNCGEGYVFAKYGDNAWTCMTKEEYKIKQDTINHNALSALGWSTAVVVIGVALIIYFFNRD